MTFTRLLFAAALADAANAVFGPGQCRPADGNGRQRDPGRSPGYPIEINAPGHYVAPNLPPGIHPQRSVQELRSLAAAVVLAAPHASAGSGNVSQLVHGSAEPLPCNALVP